MLMTLLIEERDWREITESGKQKNQIQIILSSLIITNTWKAGVILFLVISLRGWADHKDTDTIDC